ncbi:MAG: aminotransferase class V-fold PLP-dependent enzyme [Actinomycetota bacterium]
MSLPARGFGDFGGRAWFNAAHQGPLPRVAARALIDQLEAKLQPASIADEDFARVPERLRDRVARLIGASADEIVLGNSTSYGLHLVANGLRWAPGDEVVVVEGDFPATILPWLGLERTGVVVRRLKCPGGRLTPDLLEESLSPATRVVAVSWVNSFTGATIDAASIGRVCRGHDVWFVLNATQAVGARPLDVGELPVDAVVTCGFKWLCGPYGTGFAWLRRALLDTLDLNHSYWLARQTEPGLDFGQADRDAAERPEGGRRYDVFGTANFFNFVPWTAALDYLLELGVERIAAHDQALVQAIVDSLSPDYELVSPRSGPDRSTLVMIEHRNGDRSEAVARALHQAGVDVAVRAGRIRLSPHLYNSESQVEQAIEVLANA